MNAAEITERVIRILANHSGLHRSSVTRDTPLREIISDSLDFVEIVMDLEDEFAIKIPDADIEKFQTAGQLIDYIQKRIQTEDAVADALEAGQAADPTADPDQPVNQSTSHRLTSEPSGPCVYYRTPLLEWRRGRKRDTWFAEHPCYHTCDEETPCEFLILEYGPRAFGVFLQGVPIRDTPPAGIFHDFRLAALAAEAQALRDLVSVKEVTAMEGGAINPGRYFDGCRAIAIFAPGRNQGMRFPAMQEADRDAEAKRGAGK